MKGDNHDKFTKPCAILVMCNEVITKTNGTTKDSPILIAIPSPLDQSQPSTSSPTDDSILSLDYKAGYIIYHPERRNLLPRFHPLKSFTWKCFQNLTDYGLMVYKTDIYLFGGFDHKVQKPKRDIWRYIPEEGRWLFCCKMLEARCNFTPFLFDGKIFCAGGHGKTGRLLNSVEYFEPILKICYYDEPLPLPCANYGACSTSRGEAFIIGGIVQTPMGNIATTNHFLSITKRRVEKDGVFQGIEMQWVNLKNVKFPTSSGICGLQCVYHIKEDRIYTVGGTDSVDISATSNEEYLPKFYDLHYINMEDVRTCLNSKEKSTSSVNSWRLRHISACRRTRCAANLIGNKLFILGGVKSEQSCNGNIPEGSDIGYYDCKRKKWIDALSLQNCGIKAQNVKCVLVYLNENFKEFDSDRLGWLLQWALW